MVRGYLVWVLLLCIYPFSALAESANDIESKIATIDNAIEVEKEHVKQLISNVERNIISPDEADQAGEAIERNIENLQLERTKLSEELAKTGGAHAEQPVESSDNNDWGWWRIIKWLGGAIVVFALVGSLSSKGGASGGGGEKRNFKCDKCGANSWLVTDTSFYDEEGRDPTRYNYKEWLTCQKCGERITNEKLIR